jgi:hypothetical protein
MIAYIENEQKEQKYLRLSELGRELGVPGLGAFLVVEVFDRGDRCLYAHKQRSHSWNRNAYNWFLCQVALVTRHNTSFGDGALTVKDISGTIHADYAGTIGWNGRLDTTFPYTASAGQTNQGIVVGSGASPEDFNGYVLSSLIANGTGAGQLTYQAGSKQAAVWNSSTNTFSIEWLRYFNNNSGGAIDVNEVALVGSLHCFASSVSYKNVMFCRDVLAATITVPDTGQLKVTYAIELVYPE